MRIWIYKSVSPKAGTTLLAGQEYDVPDELGQRYIDAEYALAVQDKPGGPHGTSGPEP